MTTLMEIISNTSVDMIFTQAPHTKEVPIKGEIPKPRCKSPISTTKCK